MLLVPAHDAPIGVPPDVSTIVPFLIKQFGFTSMRYQQVYAASAFSNLPPACIYITSLTTFLDAEPNRIYGWTIRNMQINLSTTLKSIDSLSSVFAENVGKDDIVVFGPASHDFLGIGGNGELQIVLDRPFQYSPTLGNLLVDIRIFDANWPMDPNNPRLDSQATTNDSVSSVLATNVMATAADSVASDGLYTVIQFSAVPSMQIQIESVFGTNRPVIRWPAQPSVFAPQTSTLLGTQAAWQTISNNIGGSPNGPDRWIYLPVQPPGQSAFYRLFWDSGQPLQSSPLPTILGITRETSPHQIITCP